VKNVSDKVLDKTKTHIIFSKFLPPENPAVYEIIWKNIVNSDKPHDNI